MKSFVVALLALSTLTGCKGSQIDDAEMEYIPMKLDDDKSWSLVSADGEVFISAEFQNTPSPVFRGIFSVQEGKGYSLYYAKKKPELVPGCDDLMSVGMFACDDYAPITRKGKRISVIDRDGEEIFILEPQNKKEIIACYTGFTDGMLVVMNEAGKYGAFNRDGDLAVPCVYDYLTPFNEGIALSAKKDSKNRKLKYFVIDHENNTLASIKKNLEPMSAWFRDGKIAISLSDDKPAVLTREGEIFAFPDRVKQIVAIKDEYYIYRGESGFGLLDGEDVKIRDKYSYLAPIDKDWKRFLACADDKNRIIDRDGWVIATLDYKYVRVVAPNTLAAGDKTAVLLDEDGKVKPSKLNIKGIDTDMTCCCEVNPCPYWVVTNFAKAKEAVKLNKLHFLTNDDFKHDRKIYGEVAPIDYISLGVPYFPYYISPEEEELLESIPEDDEDEEEVEVIYNEPELDEEEIERITAPIKMAE